MLNYNKSWIEKRDFEDVGSVIFLLFMLITFGMALYGVAEMPFVKSLISNTI